jgi:hypothetical protein
LVDTSVLIAKIDVISKAVSSSAKEIFEILKGNGLLRPFFTY